MNFDESPRKVYKNRYRSPYDELPELPGTSNKLRKEKKSFLTYVNVRKCKC